MRYLPAFTFLAVVGAAVLGTAARGAAPAAASPNIFYSLPAGESPAGALLQGQDGNIYGATATGGTNNSGAIFEVTLGGRMTNLFSFDGTNGSAPLAGPIQDSMTRCEPWPSDSRGFFERDSFRETRPHEY